MRTRARPPCSVRRADRAGDRVAAVRGAARARRDVPRVDRDADAALARARASGSSRRRRAAPRAAAGERPRVAVQQVAAGEAGDERVGGPREQLLRRAELVQPAVEHDADAVGERGRVGEVVGDDQRRDRELGQHVGQLLADARRGCARRARRAARRAAAPPGRAPARARPRRAGARRRTAAPGFSPARCAMPSRSSSSSTRSRAAEGDVARTVMCGNSAYSWNTSPTERRSGGRSIRARVSNQTSSPSAIRPARRAGAGPATARSTVVLPAPDGPTSATVSAPTVSATSTLKARSGTVRSSSSGANARGACRRAGRRR